MSNLHSIETCTCVEHKTTALPCRHIFFSRRLMNKSLFDANMVPDRLKLGYSSKSLYNVETVSSTISTSIAQLNSIDSSKQLSAKEKYNLVWRCSQELCNAFTSMNDRDFEDKFNIFLTIKSYFEKKVFYSLNRSYFKLFLKLFYLFSDRFLSSCFKC